MFFYNLQKEIEKWLFVVNKENSLPNEIIAINFGLFNDGDKYNIYLIGSKTYTKNNNDWACNEDYIPKNKYFIVKNKSINNLEWNKFLLLSKETIQNILLNDVFSKELFGEVKHITMGYDDGDLNIIK